MIPIYVAIKDKEERIFFNKLILSRIPIFEGNIESLVEELTVLSFARFYDQDSFDQIADYVSFTHEPIFVLRASRPENYRHPNIFFANDDPDEIVTMAFKKALKRADEGMTPQTKEFAIVSIADSAERHCIIKLLKSLKVGIFINNQGDYRFLETLWGNCFARFLDAPILALIQDEIKSHLDVDTGPFILVGECSLPFSHPQLVLLKDKPREWLEQVLKDGRKWDDIESERFHEALGE
jgi:hypothetical protein